MAVYSVVENKRVGQTMKTVDVDSIILCSSMCSTEDGCVSLSYQTSSNTCELNDRNPVLDGYSQSISISGWTSAYSEIAACPTGWIQYFTHCYMLNTNIMRWSAADSFCRSVDAHLVDIQDSDEWQFVYTAADGNFIWIGLNDLVSEGNYVWTSTLTSPTVTFFDKGDNEPDGGKNQNCVGMYHVNGLWYDLSCGVEKKVFCKKGIY